MRNATGWYSKEQRSRWLYRRGGFTFMELVVVIVIMGVFFSLAVPNLDGLTPKYRLRTAARRIGSVIENYRILAITKGVTLGVRYHLSTEGERSYLQLVRQPPPDYPSQPVEERASYAPEYFPAGVEIVSVQVRGSDDLYETGDVLIVFSPTGTVGSHLVTLRNQRGWTWTVKLNAIIGTIDYINTEDAGFADFEG